MRTEPRSSAATRGLLSALVLALLSLLAPTLAWGRAPDLEVWTHPDCGHCRAAHVFLEQLQVRHPDLVVVEHDVSLDDAAMDDLRKRTNEAGLASVGLPTFSVRGVLRVGFDSAETTGRTLEALLASPDAREPRAEVAPEEGAICVPETCAPESEKAPNPFWPTWLQGLDMTDIVTFVVFIGIWLALQTWVLPKLGVPT